MSKKDKLKQAKEEFRAHCLGTAEAMEDCSTLLEWARTRKVMSHEGADRLRDALRKIKVCVQFTEERLNNLEFLDL